MQLELLSRHLTLAMERKLVRRLSKQILIWLKDTSSQPGFDTPAQTDKLEALILLLAAAQIAMTADELIAGDSQTLVLTKCTALVDQLKQAGVCDCHWLASGLELMQETRAASAVSSAWQLLAQNEISPRLSSGERAAFIGTIYQALSQARRKLSNKNMARGAKQTDAGELISFTQILTPSWVVRLILSLALARGPALSSALTLDQLREVTVLDPCVGTGNFIFAAIDVLTDFYLGLGLSPAQSYREIMEHNLYGADIDARAVSLTCLTAQALGMSLGTQGFAPGHIVLLPVGSEDGLLGSLSPGLPDDHVLRRQYDCVVTNPPYLGRKLLDRKLKEQLKKHYQGSQSELGHCFLSRALSWCKPQGKIGFITQSSILSLPSASAIRERLLRESYLDKIIELGAGVFPLLSGEKASSTILVAQKKVVETETSDNEVSYMDWSSREDKKEWAQKICHGVRVPVNAVRKQSDFEADPGFAFNFKRPATATMLYRTLPKLASLADIKQGLATSDNERFVRFSWEITGPQSKDWLPYIKGKGTRRWYHPLENVIYWQDNGAAVKEAVNQSYPYLKGKTQWVVKNEDFYFKAGLTFSFVNSRALAVRKMPQGCIFDVGGSAIFGKDIDEDLLLAYLNSGLAMTFAQDLNPTINYQVGDLKRLPVPDFDQETKDNLSNLARQATSVSADLYSFEAPYLIPKPPGTRLDEQSFVAYRKAHHLSQEKLIELDSRNDDLVMKALNKSLTLKESTEIISWVDSSWRKPTQRFKSKSEYILAMLVTAFVQASGAGQSGNDLAVISLAPLLQSEHGSGGSFDWSLGTNQNKQILSGDFDFIDKNIEVPLTQFIQTLNDQLKSLFMQQPPFFVLQAGGAFVVPFAALMGEPATRPADWTEAAENQIAHLRAKMSGPDARAKELFELLGQNNQ